MRDLDLKRRLELAGLTVTEIDGWKERGSTTFNPHGSVHHHTAGPRKGVQPSLGVVINGRSDLPGPLCNVHGPREESLRVNLVAAGRANHAGKGGWRGLSGNSSVYGLEEEHCGYDDEPISELRIDRMARVHAAFAFELFEAEMVCQHREWAPRRKPDFVAGLLDPDAFRSRVADILRDMRNPEPEPTPEPEDDDMAPIAVRDAKDRKVWICTATPAPSRWHVPDSATLTALLVTGAARVNGPNGTPAEVPSEHLAKFPVVK